MKKNILIVEDEVLIAKQLHLSLTEHGYTCVGLAISFERALAYLQTEMVDLVLLDINLFGKKTGVDVANVINQTYKIPFIYLTSHDDQKTITAIKDTQPAGYLHKPVNDVMLTTMLDLTFSALENENPQKKYNLTIASTTYKINLEDLLYAITDHVYVELYFTEGEKKLLRTSLAGLLEALPKNTLLRVNRGTAVNPHKITKMSSTAISLGQQDFKISRTNFHKLNAYFSS